MKVLIAGDYCPLNRLETKILAGDYSGIFGNIKNVVRDSDYSIVNFELPIVNNKKAPIVKSGPNFVGVKESIDALKYAGFKACALANNHILDQGRDNALFTKKEIEKAGLETVGFGQNAHEAARALFVTINTKRLAIINCCEHEFSTATEYCAGANGLDLVSLFNSIQEAKDDADYVIVIVHGGHEYYQLPSPRMVDTYRFLIDAGANAVINHHQHCYSGYELYKDCPIIYGLGNFCFDGNRCNSDIWYYGYMVQIIFGEKESFQIIPYMQCKGDASIRLLKEEDEIASFDRTIKGLNDVIADRRCLIDFFNKWCESRESYFGSLLTPYSNRLLRWLWRHKLLPSFTSLEKIVNLKDKISCESHRDTFLFYLEKRIQSGILSKR